MTLSLLTLLTLLGVFGICLWAACLLVVFVGLVCTAIGLAVASAHRVRWRG